MAAAGRSRREPAAGGEHVVGGHVHRPALQHLALGIGRGRRDAELERRV
jgi:hypothetical protein